MTEPQTALNCAGCQKQLIPPMCHATLCPGFCEHAAVYVVAEFIKCRCGHLSVNKIDRQSHLDDMKKRKQITMTIQRKEYAEVIERLTKDPIIIGMANE